MRYELTDYEWAAIRPMLPNKARGVPRVDDRRVLNGICWVLRSGAPWRDLPVCYGPRTTCYNRFVRWRRAGVWGRSGAKYVDQVLDSLYVIEKAMRHFFLRAETGKAVGRSQQLVDEDYKQAATLAALAAPYRHARLSAMKLAGDPNSPATDQTTSAILEMHQAAASSEPNATATAPAPDAESLAGATTNATSSPTSDIAAPQQAAASSEPNAQVAASGPNAVPQIIAPIDDAASSTPNNSAAQPSNSSDFRSNDAEPIPDVSVAQPQAPLAASSVNAQPIPLDAPDWTARRAEFIDNAQMLQQDHFLLFLPSCWRWSVF